MRRRALWLSTLDLEIQSAASPLAGVLGSFVASEPKDSNLTGADLSPVRAENTERSVGDNGGKSCFSCVIGYRPCPCFLLTRAVLPQHFHIGKLTKCELVRLRAE